MLARPETAQFIAGKLYTELTGFDCDTETVERLGAQFASDYTILGLVHAIVAEPAFLADAAVRTHVRTPVEKLVTLVQATRSPWSTARPASPAARPRYRARDALAGLRRRPSLNPRDTWWPGSRPSGPLVHQFDLLSAVDGPPPEANGRDVEPLAPFGVFDNSDSSLRAVRADPIRRVGSPSPSVHPRWH